MPTAATTATITTRVAGVTFPISRPFDEVATESTGKVRSCQRRQDMPCGASASIVGFGPQWLCGLPRLVGTSPHGLPGATSKTRISRVSCLLEPQRTAYVRQGQRARFGLPPSLATYSQRRLRRKRLERHEHDPKGYQPCNYQT